MTRRMALLLVAIATHVVAFVLIQEFARRYGESIGRHFRESFGYGILFFYSFHSFVGISLLLSFATFFRVRRRYLLLIWIVTLGWFCWLVAPALSRYPYRAPFLFALVVLLLGSLQLFSMLLRPTRSTEISTGSLRGESVSSN